MESNFTAAQNTGFQAKEAFSDPFNVKSFSASSEDNALDSDFVAVVNDSANKSVLNGKQTSIDPAVCSTDDTTFFSTRSDQTDDSQSMSEINLSNLIDPNKTIDSQQTVIVKSAAQFGQTREPQASRPDDTLERSVDPFSSNAELDPFNANINAFDSLSKDDPFNSRDDFFGTSKTEEDSKLSGQSEIDFGDDESKLDEEFEQLPNNVTYLSPDMIEKHFIDESFEKLDENECAMASKLAVKLENIPEDSREHNRPSSESEGEFENEFVGPAKLIGHQNPEHSQMSSTDGQMSLQFDQTKEESKEESKVETTAEIVECLIQKAVEIRAEESKQLDKMMMWRVQNEENIKQKDAEEMKMNDQLKSSASKELDDWYATYKHERKLRMDSNR